MALKIIHCADFHIGAPLSRLTPDKASIRRSEILMGFSSVVSKCKETADALIISGDLFDSPYPYENDVKFVKQELSSLGDIPVFIVCGNHDYMCPDSVFSVEENFPENVHIFSPEGESIYIESLNAVFHGVSYSRKTAPLIKNEFTPQSGKFNVLCLHGDLTAGSDYCTYTEEKIKAFDYDYTAFGHIHDSHSFNCGKTLCAYSGTPEGHSFADDSNIGYNFVEIDSSVSLRHISDAKRKYIHLDFDITDFSSNADASSALSEKLSSENLYKIRLVGSPAFSVALSYIQDEVDKSVFYAEIFDDCDAGYNLDEILESNGFKGILLQEIKERCDNEKDFNLAAKIALNALSGIKPEMR